MAKSMNVPQPNASYPWNELLQTAAEMNATEVFINKLKKPTAAIDGCLQTLAYPAVDISELEHFVKRFVPKYHQTSLDRTGGADFFLEKGQGKWRVEVFRRKGTLAIVLRRGGPESFSRP